MSKKDLKFDPDWIVKPGETLKEEMEIWNLTSKMVAIICGVTPEIIESILDGSGEITSRIARGLSSIGVSPQFWLNLEKNYRDGLAAGKKKT